jgi:nicotinamidase-related amidase
VPAALLIIDVQRVLCEGRYRAFESERVIERINAVSRKARAAGALVVVIQHESDVHGSMAYLSDAWKLAPALETHPGDTFLRKSATDSFHQTALQSLLKAHGVTELVVCGMQSDFCVDTTTRRALGLGYPVILVSDGHSTIDNDVLAAPQIIAHHAVTLANIESFGPRVRLMAADDIVFDFLDLSGT